MCRLCLKNDTNEISRDGVVSEHAQSICAVWFDSAAYRESIHSGGVLNFRSAAGRHTNCIAAASSRFDFVLATELKRSRHGKTNIRHKRAECLRRESRR